MTNAGHVPLLFSFRGIRFLQVIVALAAGAMAIAGVIVLKSYIDEGGIGQLLMGILFGVLFLWMFGMALRLPTSFIAISQERMRLRYGGFVDAIVETRDVAGARLVPWQWWRGLGVRTGFGGGVALVAAWGTAAELTLKEPIRVWIIPRLWRVKATRVVVSVRNPQKLVDRFGPVKAEPQKSAAASSKRKRR